MQVIDSHTGGEPTRLIISGGPALAGRTMAERRDSFARDFDHIRRFAVLEPRGHDALVGALLCPPVNATSAAGVIFFNNAGYLGMCGHAAIGTIVSLAHLGRLGPGRHGLDTPVGTVAVDLHDANTATVENVPSYAHAQGIALDVPELGMVRGDIAWGGNWFFIAEVPGLTLALSQVRDLTGIALRIKAALRSAGYTGRDGAEIDHIEITGPSSSADARNFVLCPGAAYDRSPCGTGTSAKLACLAAAGKLRPGAAWLQESITGSCFAASYRETPEGIVARITGRAFVAAEATLLRSPADAFADGIADLPNGERPDLAIAAARIAAR
ncbi:MAG: proline racemase family protein [Hyphomicrobiales bacterium]